MLCADVSLTRPLQLEAIRDWKNHQAWLEFQRKYDPLLRSHCKSLRLDEPTADEICQLTWIEVARRIEQFVYDPKKSFRGWLRAVCTNKARDHLKRANHDLVLPFEERDVASRSGLIGVPGKDGPEFDGLTDDDPVVVLWRRRTEEIQAAVIAKVKPVTWDAFWLLAIMDCGLEETVTMLGISHWSAYKARERVSRYLKDEGRRLYGGGFE